MHFDEFLKVLDLLQNPDKYAAQIAELTEREESIKLSIEHLNARIDAAITQEQADAFLTESADVLAKAKVTAQDTIAKAQASFDKRLADLQVRETAADQAMQTFQNSKIQWAARKAEHIAKENELLNGRKQLDADLEDLRSKQAEVDARLNKLRQAMG